MVGFNSVQNNEKWLDFSVKNNQKTFLFATREFLILFILALHYSEFPLFGGTLCVVCTVYRTVYDI